MTGSSAPSDAEIELSIVMPCLEEAETVGICIQKASGFLDGSRGMGIEVALGGRRGC